MPAPTDLVALGPDSAGNDRGFLRLAFAQSIWRLDNILLARRGRKVRSNSAYRNYNEQMNAYLAYRAWLAGRGPWAPLALHPDASWHCRGEALDTPDGPGYGNGLTEADWAEHGVLFVVASELWHGQYYRAKDKYLGSPVSGGGSNPFPYPEPDEEPIAKDDDDMLHFLVASGGSDVPAFFTVLNTKTNVYTHRRLGNSKPGWTIAYGEPKKVTRAEFADNLSAVWETTGNQPYESPADRPVSI